MNHEGLEGSAVHSIAVIEHPALLVGVAKVFEPTNFESDSPYAIILRGIVIHFSEV